MTTTRSSNGYVRRANAGQPIVTRVTAVLAVVIAFIHFVETPSQFSEAAWLGVLFVIGGIGLLVAALGLAARQATWAWWLAALISAGMFVGGILSRTTGLFGFHESDWEASLLVSLVLEAVYLMLFFTSGFGSKDD